MKNQMKETDFLIIGQGIAGACLAFALQERGKSVVVVDLPAQNQSSVVAGGICNPITGKHLSLTWEAENIFSMLAPFYRRFEAVLGKTFFYEMPFYRRFHNIEGQNQFSAKLANPVLARFVEEVPDDRYQYWIDSPLGGWQARFSGYLKVGELLLAYRTHLQAMDAFREAHFDYNALQVGEDFCTWEGIKARNVVFCEGLHGRANPFFPDIPFSPNKGEWVRIKIAEDAPCPAILKQGIFFLPLGGGVYQVGATYHQTPLDNIPSEEGKEELLAQVRDWLKVPFEVVEQGAGVRPATRNRRPLAYWHAEHRNIGILNGLGSKGVSLAPFMTMELLKQHPDFS